MSITRRLGNRSVLRPCATLVQLIFGPGRLRFFFGLLFHAGRQRQFLRNGVAAIRNLLATGIILDIVFQMILFHSVHPGAALVVGPILTCIPYAVGRQLTTRLARGKGKR